MFGLQHCWTTTSYILNLAIADLIFCTVNIPVQAFQYFSKGWFAGKSLCIFFGAFHQINYNAEWMSLAIIALNRCVCLVHPRLGEIFFSGKVGRLIIAFIWIYAIMINVFLYFKVRSRDFITSITHSSDS